jgi:acyl-CoA thioesterase-2
VTPLRDGRTLSTRSVLGRQDDSAVISLSASFHLPEPGLMHQFPAPQSYDPDVAEDFAALMERVDEPSARWFDAIRAIFPFEIRYAQPPPRLAVRRGLRPAPRQQVFIRWPAVDADDALLHAGAAAFMSDALLLSTSLFPHGRLLDDPGVRASSLDHAMWFHRPPRADSWHLYAMESSWAGSGRALCTGRLYERSGALVATVVQEGLVRIEPSC